MATRLSTPAPVPSPGRVADVVDLHALLAGLSREGHDFAEVFRAPEGTLSLTVARWPAGSIDDQQPHAEDEVYYVARGRAALTIGEESVSVGPGSIALVAAGAEHRFTGIEEDLEVLVFWAPARNSNEPR